MVIDEPETFSDIIMKAAAKANCRVVVQSGWSTLDVSGEQRCFNIGPCPHDWLLPLMAAVIHHGGAGTTAAGLRYGKPTLICPFFGDQFMWGAMIHRSGVGPAPCPVHKVTVELLSEKLIELLSNQYQEAAASMASKMQKEDGIKEGLNHFLSALPIDNMLCDVSLIMGEAKIAKYKLEIRGNIKLSMEVAAFIQTSTLLINYGLNRLIVKPYDLGYAETCFEGYRYGVYGFFYYVVAAFYRVFKVPDKYARSHGAFGCLFGLILSPIYFVFYVGRAILIFIDRLGTGICNGCCHKRYIYLCDKTISDIDHVKVTKTFEEEMRVLRATELSKSRSFEIRRALELAMNARAVFKKASPFYPDKTANYRVVKTKDLLEALSAKLFKEKVLIDLHSFTRPFRKEAQTGNDSDDRTLGTTVGKEALAKIENMLKNYESETLGFTKFCFILQKAIELRPPTESAIDAGLDYRAIYSV